MLVRISDILPPSFGVTCPSSSLLVYAERGLFSTQVNWNEPVATDNSGFPPVVSSNYKPLQRLNQGSHVIIYNAVDQSENRASCIFIVTVQGWYISMNLFLINQFGFSLDVAARYSVCVLNVEKMTMQSLGGQQMFVPLNTHDAFCLNVPVSWLIFSFYRQSECNI